MIFIILNIINSIRVMDKGNDHCFNNMFPDGGYEYDDGITISDY